MPSINVFRGTNDISEDAAILMVGKGWEPLVRRVYASIREVAPYVRVTTVKEKFGGLRIYPNVYDDRLEPHIIQACKDSLSICELCGEEGSMRKIDHRRYATRCDSHAKGYPTIPDPLG